MMHRVPKATATAGDAPGEYTAKVTLEMPGEWAARIVVDKPRRTTVVRKFRVDCPRPVRPRPVTPTRRTGRG
jgi:hypothetical protein